MRRVSVSLVLLVATTALGLIAGIASSTAAPGQLMAGAAKVDASWHVGASAGQYADNGTFVGVHGVDPGLHATRKNASYGIQSRLEARALVIEGDNGEKVAIVKNDLYIPQDLLYRRTAQILERATRDHAGEPHDGRHARSLLALLLVDLVGRVGLPGRIRRALLRLLREEDGGGGRAREREPPACARRRRRDRVRQDASPLVRPRAGRRRHARRLPATRTRTTT